ncbi:hypothetical protein KIH74_09675 [Kineosporia sp. J2-2]|uniref:Uncharacterized protein n=1 Tax=Kineosporia corallincola TaxID=2835133 RepID=A0ABS5TDL3_9ACTN|nr:hypothetical protein [Kineosporia corallincola]MBT0769188.1 hypothetical protein [Kineosporia corallincola]
MHHAPEADGTALRRCVLAVSVLDDIDLEPADDGVLVPDLTGVLVTWQMIRQVVGSEPAESETARHRVGVLLRLHRLAADLGDEAAAGFREALRLVALPPGHADHLGPDWVVQALPGGALELGYGVYGLLDDPDRCVPLPPSLAARVGARGRDSWAALREYTERMGALSAARLARDGVSGVIRPVGGCDVLALLTSRTLRKHLAEGDGVGMRAVASPTRQRAWYDLRHVDPDFVRTAWHLTDGPERGLETPLLVTTDEVAVPRQPRRGRHAAL